MIQLSTIRIVSGNMTSFLVLNHDRVRYCNGTLSQTITIDVITLPMITSTICKTLAHSACKKLDDSLAKEPISTHAKRAT
jgi:hypothetical protein